jgi:hypothetical protein
MPGRKREDPARSTDESMSGIRRLDPSPDWQIGNPKTQLNTWGYTPTGKSDLLREVANPYNLGPGEGARRSVPDFAIGVASLVDLSGSLTRGRLEAISKEYDDRTALLIRDIASLHAAGEEDDDVPDQQGDDLDSELADLMRDLNPRIPSDKAPLFASIRALLLPILAVLITLAVAIASTYWSFR